MHPTTSYTPAYYPRISQAHNSQAYNAQAHNSQAYYYLRIGQTHNSEAHIQAHNSQAHIQAHNTQAHIQAYNCPAHAFWRLTNVLPDLVFLSQVLLAPLSQTQDKEASKSDSKKVIIVHAIESFITGTFHPHKGSQPFVKLSSAPIGYYFEPRL